MNYFMLFLMVVGVIIFGSIGLSLLYMLQRNIKRDIDKFYESDSDKTEESENEEAADSIELDFLKNNNIYPPGKDNCPAGKYVECNKDGIQYILPKHIITISEGDRLPPTRKPKRFWKILE